MVAGNRLCHQGGCTAHMKHVETETNSKLNIKGSNLIMNQKAPKSIWIYFWCLLNLLSPISSTLNPEEAASTRPARLKSYVKHLTAITKRYPEDKSGRAFHSLATLALGSVGKCAAHHPDPQCREAILNKLANCPIRLFECDFLFSFASKTVVYLWCSSVVGLIGGNLNRKLKLCRSIL